MLKAIETRYAGHRFRSRLEARWAVFFDSLGWGWNYEPEGYELPCSGWYLPDFLVTPPPEDGWFAKQFWVEVKPQRESGLDIAEENKLRELACRTGIFGFFGLDSNFKSSHREIYQFSCAFGDPEEPYVWCDRLFTGGAVPHSIFSPLRSREERESLVVDPDDRLRFLRELDDLLLEATRPSKVSFDRVERAQAAALSARFEHGETPEPDLFKEVEASTIAVGRYSFEDLIKHATEVLSSEESPVVQRHRLYKLAMNAGLRSEHHLDSLVAASLRLNDGKRGANAFG